MYNKLKQILYLIILILAPLTNNPSSAPGWTDLLGFFSGEEEVGGKDEKVGARTRKWGQGQGATKAGIELSGKSCLDLLSSTHRRLTCRSSSLLVLAMKKERKEKDEEGGKLQ